jgi:DNA replication licensing factor MCM3
MSGGHKSGFQVVTREFLKKYISFVKSQNDPELTDDSLSLCASLYAGLRQKATNHDQDKVSVPVTVRTLETMIRLATAHSKLRASKTVEMNDVEIAFGMLKASIFNEQMDKKAEPAKADEEMEDESEEVIPTSRSRARKRERPTELSQPPVDDDKKIKKMKVDHVE